MALLSPIGNSSVVDSAGDPAVGWRWYTYAAGTSTPLATYTTQAGDTEQANPIELNSLGLPDDPVWLAPGVEYKFVLTDDSDVTQATFDDVLGVPLSYGDVQDSSLFSGSITASVSGNDLTFALKTRDGNDPSAASPVYIAFRNSTLTNGTVVIRSITGAKSVTVVSGASLGGIASTAMRVYCGAIDNAGTVELTAHGAIGQNATLGLGNLKRFEKSALQSTTAIDSTSDTAYTLYSTTARSNVPYRYLGYAIITPGASFIWNAAPSVIKTLAGNDPLSGDVIQRMIDIEADAQSTTTVLPADRTIPLSTEGALALSPVGSWTPQLIEARPIRVSGTLLLSSGTAGQVSAAIFFDTTCVFATGTRQSGTSTQFVAVPFDYVHAANTASAAVSVTVRYGLSTAGTCYLCSDGTGEPYGGVAYSYGMVFEEICP